MAAAGCVLWLRASTLLLWGQLDAVCGMQCWAGLYVKPQDACCGVCTSACRRLGSHCLSGYIACLLLQLATSLLVLEALLYLATCIIAY